MANDDIDQIANGDRRVSRKRYPGRYKSMLAICSDLDETRTAADYFDIAKYLNTQDATPYGNGIGLEIGNSIYFDMPEDQFSYWNCDDYDRSRIHRLIKSGHVDCIHSYGDLAKTRETAKLALEDLEKFGCRIRTWIDHAIAPSNFGADIMHGCGDIEDSECYHADLTISHGIEYVWLGRVTSVVGQSVSPGYLDIIDFRRPITSVVTVAKELAKKFLSFFPANRYSLHRDNAISRRISLRSGHSVHEFMRCNPHPGGVSECETMLGIPEVLTDDFIDRLVSRAAVSIIYTHLGKNGGGGKLVPEASSIAFRRLAKRQQRDDVLVCTTSRLLDYCQLNEQIRWQVNEEGDCASIDCTLPEGLSPDGLGFKVYGYDRARLICNGKELAEVSNCATSRGSTLDISAPWKQLQFPSLST